MVSFLNMLRAFRNSERVSRIAHWCRYEMAVPSVPLTRGFTEEATVRADLDHVGEFRETVRTFAEGFVAPHAAEIDKTNR